MGRRTAAQAQAAAYEAHLLAQEAATGRRSGRSAAWPTTWRWRRCWHAARETWDAEARSRGDAI